MLAKLEYAVQCIFQKVIDKVNNIQGCENLPHTDFELVSYNKTNGKSSISFDIKNNQFHQGDQFLGQQ